MEKEMLIEEAKEILEQHGFVVEKNKYNFYPKKPIKNLSMKEGLIEAEKEHKKVLDYLKDK
jgi:hypothetical protein